MKKYMKKVMSIFLAVCLFCSFGTLSAFAAETDPAPVVIGEFDGLLKDCWTSDAPIPRAVANVRINSYATYDKEDAILRFPTGGKHQNGDPACTAYLFQN